MVSLEQISIRKYNNMINSYITENAPIYTILSRLEMTDKYPLNETLSLINTDQIQNNDIIKPVFEYVLNTKNTKVYNVQLKNIIEFSSKYTLKENYKLIKDVSEKINCPELIKECQDIISCERILNNHKKLNEYSNINSVISKAKSIEDDDIIESIVTELCDYINDYNMNYNMKLTVALENINYGLGINHIKYNKDNVLNNILEYFCLCDNYDYNKTINILEQLDISKKYLIEGKKFDNVANTFKEFLSTSKEKTSKNIKTVIKKLYTNSPQNIIDELPSILGWLRKLCVFGTIGINAPIGIVLFATDCLLELKIKRNEIDRVIKQYKKEKDKVENRMYGTSNPKTEEKYKKLNDELEKSLDKLESYKSSLYSDKENEERLYNEYGILIDYNDIDSCNNFIFSLECALNEYYFLDNNEYEVVFEDTRILNEKAFHMNKKAKMAGLKLKNNIQRLSDKDKILSNKLDAAYERMQKKFDSATTNKSREAVIKGSILPSFSALIKLALSSGLLGAAIHPVMGAISFLGGLAVSKHITNKERKYILEEIDIQLEIVTKKMSLAESNNDLKSLEELLRMQKKLKRERQRIIYKGRARDIVVVKNNRD